MSGTWHWACCCGSDEIVHGVILHGTIARLCRIHDDWHSHHRFDLLDESKLIAYYGNIGWNVDATGHFHAAFLDEYDDWHLNGLCYSGSHWPGWGYAGESMDTDVSLRSFVPGITPNVRPGVTYWNRSPYIAYEVNMAAPTTIRVVKGRWSKTYELDLGTKSISRLVDDCIVALYTDSGPHFLAKAEEFYGAAYHLIHWYRHANGNWYFNDVTSNVTVGGADMMRRCCVTKENTIYFVDRVKDGSDYGIRTWKWQDNTWTYSDDFGLPINMGDENYGISALVKPGQSSLSHWDYPILHVNNEIYYPDVWGGWTVHPTWNGHNMTAWTDVLELEFDDQSRPIIMGLDDSFQYQIARYNSGAWEYYQVVEDGSPIAGWLAVF